jgi:hypothetical protein
LSTSAPAQSAASASIAGPFRRIFTFPAAILSLLIFLIAYAGDKFEINEPDIWWHLRNAKQILMTHSFPRFDTYSFTSAGSAWIDHEWLSELIYYGAFKALGLRGIVLLFFGISVLTFCALYYLSCKAGANPKTAGAVSVLGILVASVSFGPRMLLFGWLAMSILLIILQRYAAARPAPVWILPALFALWVNLHGSWLFGLIVFGVFIVSGLFNFEIGNVVAKRFSRNDLKKLLTTAGVCILALFINPFGYKLVGYPFDMLFRQQTNMQHVEEWRSVDFHDPRGKIVMILLLVILATAVCSRRKWMLHEVLLGAFALYSSLTYWRMQYFAALIFIPLIATRITLFADYNPKKEKPVLNAAIIAVVIGVMIWRFPAEDRLRARVAEIFPEAALSYMEKAGMTDHVLNEYFYGGYMTWRSPEIKDFIDGRADLFVYNGTFDDYVRFSRIDQSLEILDKYKIKYVLLSRQNPNAYLLGNVPRWRRVYNDNLATVFARAE